LPCLNMQVKFFRQVSPPEADDGHVKEFLSGREESGAPALDLLFQLGRGGSNVGCTRVLARSP